MPDIETDRDLKEIIHNLPSPSDRKAARLALAEARAYVLALAEAAKEAEADE
jgi:hypothetical protein